MNRSDLFRTNNYSIASNIPIQCQPDDYCWVFNPNNFNPPAGPAYKCTGYTYTTGQWTYNDPGGACLRTLTTCCSYL